MTRWLRRATAYFRSCFPSARLDRELDEEMASHLDLAIEENINKGMSAEGARRQAQVRFGGLEQATQKHREARGVRLLDIVIHDLRYSFRSLRRDYTFTLLAILILALGIGANVAVFSVINTILLRPLPFRAPQRLVRITRPEAKGGESTMTYSVDATRELREQNRSYDEVTGYYPFTGDDNYALMGRGEPLPVTGIMVAENFFQTLGVEPLFGRSFIHEENLKNSRSAVLLSYPFWQRHFAGDRTIVGQTIDLSGSPTLVVGILPDTFDFGSVFSPGAKIDVFTPFIGENFRDDGNDLALIARMKPGITLPQAQAEADLLFPRLHFNLRHPDWNAHYSAKVLGLKDYVSGKLRRSLVVLWCAVGLILLIVCVNLSNLLLGRAATRSKEFAMRSALGAGRGRLIGQLLTESLSLSCAGSLLGLGLAVAITRYLAHQSSVALPLLSSVRIDGAAVFWTLFIATAVGVLLGLAPGLRIRGGNLQEAIKDTGPGLSQGRKHESLRSALVISELALACVLLVGAGLLLRSFLRLLDVDLGFEPSRAAAIKVDYNDGGDMARRSAIWQEILDRVAAIPGIEAAGISDNLPLSTNRSWGIRAKGGENREGEIQGTFVFIVSPGYLRAIGMHLREGRDFDWHDDAKSEKVVIINETVAHRLWPGEDPIGRIAVADGDARVVGVISDVQESSVEGEAGWQMYLPATQEAPDGAELVVRTKLPPDLMGPSVMSTLRAINPEQPRTEFRPIQQLVDHATSPRRFFVLLVSAFAGIGLILASLGIYGVISYAVTQRTQEIGVRMALGASRTRVQFDVIKRTLRLALIGIGAGTVASLATVRLIASILFGTRPTDPMTFIGMIALLSSVAFVAGYVPARRASRINPMAALRNN